MRREARPAAPPLAPPTLEQAADHGNTNFLYRSDEKPALFTRLWPYGLDHGGAAPGLRKMDVDVADENQRIVGALA
ncbi:hypothetical protein BCL76_11553 [Streptomyces sp. CG 926]|nr:hypothetical protein BCL76_11553 [Streptomyces sp. CG 926]